MSNATKYHGSGFLQFRASIDITGLDQSDFGAVHAHIGVLAPPETWKWLTLTFLNKELGLWRAQIEWRQNKMSAATKVLMPSD